MHILKVLTIILCSLIDFYYTWEKVGLMHRIHECFYICLAITLNYKVLFLSLIGDTPVRKWSKKAANFLVSVAALFRGRIGIAAESIVLCVPAPAIGGLFILRAFKCNVIMFVEAVGWFSQDTIQQFEFMFCLHYAVYWSSKWEITLCHCYISMLPLYVFHEGLFN